MNEERDDIRRCLVDVIWEEGGKGCGDGCEDYKICKDIINTWMKKANIEQPKVEEFK